MKKTLVLFDFDGTITTKDSFIEFIKFYKGLLYFYLSIPALLPSIGLFKLKLLSAQQLKEYFLTFFFKGEYELIFKQKAKEFSLNIIPLMVKKNALEKINLHINNNDRVIIVSASMTEWIEPWCVKTGVEHITSGLEYRNNVITGKIDGLNCNKEEKSRRIKEKVDLNSYSNIIAYGNSSGDASMLDLANEKYYNLF